MCGILGLVNFHQPIDGNQLAACRKGLKSLSHRGPDGEGEFHSNSVYLGHRRLSVIDLRNIANQPFLSEDGRYALVFNGEIYNYLELRDELKRQGSEFITDSDTEVLLKTLMYWGMSGLSRLDGMFAGALYDVFEESLHLFRDPLGQKPLYVFHDADRLMFASEINPILIAHAKHWRIDRDAFQSYVVHGYHPWTTTPLQGIEKVGPGGLMTCKAGQVTSEFWWNSVPGHNQLDITFPEAVNEFERLFDRSCLMTMRSDVPVGVFLSGGLDSTAVLSSCHKAVPDLHAYSVAMAETDYDESPKAVAATAHEAIEFHTTIKLTEDALLECFDELMQRIDEPHADPGFVNAYFLSREARKDITVAIAGDGADELLGGYIPFKGLTLCSALSKLPDSLMETAKRAVQMLPASDRYLGLRFMAQAYMQGFPALDINRPSAWLATLPPEELRSLLTNAPGLSLDTESDNSIFAVAAHHRTDAAHGSFTQQLLYYYQQIFLPEFVSQHTDRAAMMHGLEVRAPFLSTALIDFCNRLPDQIKVRGGELKSILRHILVDRGYPKTITSQSKQGFTFPIARWLKSGMRDLVEGLDDVESFTGGELNGSAFREMIRNHLEGKQNNYRIIYTLLVFQKWRQRFPQVTF